MIAVLVNTLAVLFGSLIGIAFRNRLKPSLRDAVMKALGLCTMLIGISSAIETKELLCVILCMVLGTVLGELLRIDDGLEHAGDAIKAKLAGRRASGKASLSASVAAAPGGGEEGTAATAASQGEALDSGSSFTEGFVSACILFCIGSMTIMGSLEAGIRHNYSIIYAKSLMDFMSSMAFGAAMGFGVTCSAAFVLVFQGGLTLLAGWIGNALTDAVVTEMSAVGGVILIGMSLNLLGLGKERVKVSNMLPAIFLPILYFAVTALF